MADTKDFLFPTSDAKGSDLSQFADSYASFNRIINTLQRKYIELKDDFSAQNQTLVETNRQLMELSTRHLAANEFLNGMLQSMKAGVIAVDQDGIITHFNPAASLMLGIPGREPLGRHYRDVIPAGDPPEANALRAAESGKSLDSVEKRWDLPDGTRLVVSVSTAILRDKHEMPNGAAEVFHDLTKIKKMEQEITRLNTLAALGEMAAAVAHQVRNPLSGILGYGSLLRRDMAPDDPRQKLINRICDGVEALNRTVTTLLSYTQNQELNTEQIPFEDFLNDTIVYFKRSNEELAADVEIAVQPPGHPDGEKTLVSADPVLLREVLNNLFTNACEACCSEGTISIVYRILPRQRAAERYGDRLLLGLDETVFEMRIADTGPGICEEDRANIFAPFYTTKTAATAWDLRLPGRYSRPTGAIS